MTEESQQQIANNTDEISLKELILKIQYWWHYLLSKWSVILIFWLLGASLGLAYAYVKKPIYTATTTFVLEDEKGGSGLGNLTGLASMAGVDLGGNGGGIFQGDNILELYKSRMMLEQTLLTKFKIENREELLVDRYIAISNLKEKWADRPELLHIDFKSGIAGSMNSPVASNRLRDSILGVVVADLNKSFLTVSKPDKKLSTIQVDVKSKDEVFAKSFNDALVKNVNEFYINTKTRKTLNNVKILQHKTDSVRSVMNGSIFKAVAIADATPNLNPTRQIQRVAPAQKAQFSAETNRAILGEMVKNLEMSKMSLLRETPLIQLIDHPVFPLRVDRFTKLKGIILGGIAFAFLASFLLIIKGIIKEILN